MTLTDKAKPHDFVQSFANGLQVIRAFNAEHPKMTLAEVASHCAMTRAVEDAQAMWNAPDGSRISEVRYTWRNPAQLYL